MGMEWREINDLLFKKLLRNKAVTDGAISSFYLKFYLYHLLNIRASKFTYVSLSIPHTTQITWTTNIDLNAFTSASGARRLSRVFQYYPTQSKWFPQKLEYVIWKLLFVEYYPSFGVERIRRILFLGYRLWFTSSCGFLVLLCKRRDSNESPLTIIYSASFSIQVPQNREKQCCSIFISFNS